jgi:hypothetical protein
VDFRIGEMLSLHYINVFRFNPTPTFRFNCFVVRDLVGHKVDLAMVKRNPICRIDKVDIVRTNKSWSSSQQRFVSQDGIATMKYVRCSVMVPGPLCIQNPELFFFPDCGIWIRNTGSYLLT